MKRRASGVLLHPTSLPGPYGIGDVGPGARGFLQWLDAAGQRIWQVLPLNPVDHAGCPYASPSAFASEPLLLSIDDLVDDRLLRSAEKPYAPDRAGRVDWAGVRARKGAALRLAADRLRTEVDLRAWAQTQPELATWATYKALADELGAPWPVWPEALRDRAPDALAAAADRLAGPIERELALQWLFDRQWDRLRTEAKGRGIALWGDVPIFVGLACADPWSAPWRWRLDGDRRPVVVSGVPPDAFSVDGQLWGHPLYDEEAHRREGFTWWIARMRRVLTQVDRVRIDHFRGFEAVWEVAAHATDARGGRWIPGPGRPLLDALRAAFGDPRTGEMPFVAEDLGVITDDVKALRDAYHLPGMVILQFAFNGDALDRGRHDHGYLPHNHRPHQVCYTGTHDNDTALGWYRGTDEGTRGHVREYLAASDDDQPWALVRAALRSVCDTVVVPIQDLLGKGSEARVNVPGRVDGNWSWRMDDEPLSLSLAGRVAHEVLLSGRSR
ncbi:MAG: 4-alpha-glucanotransferase [Myxococcota bacterium]